MTDQITKKAQSILRTIWADGPQCVFRGDGKYYPANFNPLKMDRKYEDDLVGVYDERITLPQLVEDIKYFEKWAGEAYPKAVKVA